VNFNGGMLDFGIGGPVNDTDWLSSWVAGGSQTPSNDFTVVVP
jgi:hypothetical protein